MSKHRDISRIGVVTDGSIILVFDDQSHTYLTTEDLDFILEKLNAIAKQKLLNEEE